MRLVLRAGNVVPCVEAVFGLIVDAERLPTERRADRVALAKSRAEQLKRLFVLQRLGHLLVLQYGGIDKLGRARLRADRELRGIEIEEGH